MTTSSPRPAVAFALGFPEWESALVAGLSHPSSAVKVTRRCVDVTDAIAYTATTAVDVIVVAAALPGLDAHTAALLSSQVRMVIAVAADDAQRAQAESLGLSDCVLVDPSHPARAVAAVTSLIRRDAFAHALAVMVEESDSVASARPLGVLIEVAGPHGSVGRTTTAVAIADEAVSGGRRCLLVDADVRAGSVDQMLGIADNRAGVNVLLRELAAGHLDADALWHSAVEVQPGMRAIVGPAGARLVRPELWRRLLAMATCAADIVVVDRGAVALDDADEDLRDLSTADAVVLVGGSDPIAFARLLRCINGLRAMLPRQHWLPVVSRDRVDDRRWHEYVTHRLARDCADDSAGQLFVADDTAACARALQQGRPLSLTAPRSKVRRDLRALTEHVLQVAYAA